jgi:pimeloyl-ACP methyl ester carboxylesterase
MTDEIRYCQSADGTRIAYSISGDGPPVLRCPGVWESMVAEWPGMDVYDRVDRGHTAIRYDFRGVGLSARNAASYTLNDFVSDIEAVARAAGLDRFAVTASQFSSPAAIAFAAQNPQRVTRLILTRVAIRGSDVISEANLDALITLIRSSWVMASQILADMGTRGGDPTYGLKGAELLRENVEAEAMAIMLSDLHRTTDVSGLLKDIQCPTLVIHRREDAPFMFAAAQDAAALIPAARLVAPPGAGPVSFGEDAEQNIEKMVAFLDEDLA